jgi:ubiquinone/menaquinone biosynthesis C-methylase UbiE
MTTRDDRPLTNADENTVRGFGDEWTRFDHSDIDEAPLERVFSEYFSEFPWATLPPDAEGADLGCGSGRWARFVAPRCGRLHCVDASPDALAVAQRNLGRFDNCEFIRASVSDLPFADRSLDFAYSLGVLHHVPDTADAIRHAVRKLKPGAPFLVYLYYAFDNRSRGFRAVWQLSNVARRVISRMPLRPRALVADVLAGSVYLPLALTSRALESLDVDVSAIPLSYYRDKSFYMMRNDSLDRFGTRLEQRFTRAQIADMLTAAGLRDIRFRDAAPFWCAVGIAR